MAVTTTTLVAVAAVAAIAGAGMSAYSSIQQGKNAERVAEYNAQIQQQQSDLQSRMAVRQSQINQRMLETQQNQAIGIRQQANAKVKQAAEDVRRSREGQRRFMATQTAGFAKSGVMMSGSPLAVLAETAGIMELQNQDIAYKGEMEARALHREAELSKYGLGADLAVEKMNEAAGHAAGRIGAANASITRLQGAAAKQGYNYQAVGSILSGVGSAASGVGGYIAARPVTPGAVT